MLKKTYLASVYNGLQQCTICSASNPSCKSTTSPYHLPVQRARPQNEENSNKRRCTRTEVDSSRWSLSPFSPKLQRRTYATVRDGVDFRDNMNWPCRNGQSAPTTGSNPLLPSPYEIFDMRRADRYGRNTKLKYYELVKIYHPDRSSISEGCGLSRLELLERYRLIVLAHEILSDPDKRRAYDAYGAGWGTRASATRHSRGYSGTTGQQYGQGAGFDNSPFGNATWEDWERWYRRNAPHDQHQAYQGIFLNPNAFAAFVIVAAILSGILQATRVSNYSSAFTDKQLAFTEETTRFMTARASQFDENRLDKDGRVRHFLERRDPTRYGLKEEEEVQYRKHFQDTDDVVPLGRSRSPKDAGERDNG